MAQKIDLIKHVKETLNCTNKAAKEAVDAVLCGIEDLTITTGELRLKDHGLYTLKHRPERKGTDPHTGKPMLLNASNSITFKVGKAFKENAND